MPGWHDELTKIAGGNEIQMLGVAIEQHPDRSHLFMTWKGMKWPLLWDPFNLLELPAVPITLILDGDGVIRLMQPKLERAQEIVEFTRKSAWDDAGAEGRLLPSPVPGIEAMAEPTARNEEAWSDHAVALTLWGGSDRLDEAVAASESAVASHDQVQGRTWFRRGVILRKRYDSSRGRPSDISLAAEAWTNALEADPNNYIWRRRLQQYGPRLSKPYAFYDWIGEARTDIARRGEDVPDLVVEPEGAEYADPSAAAPPEGRAEGEVPAPPDPRIAADLDEWINVSTSVIPARVEPGDVARVRLEMAPRDSGEVHWNNEAGPGGLWVRAPIDWEVEPTFQEVAVPAQATSDEPRQIAFEVRVPPSAGPGGHTVSAVALYAVCDDETGVCLLRQREVSIPLVVERNGVRLRD